MEVIKKLGNNAAICKDNSGRELIALGLGIGVFLNVHIH